MRTPLSLMPSKWLMMFYNAGVRSITDLMIMPGLINLDFADVRTVMSEMGKAMMGTGEAEGDGRAIAAAEAAIANPLLDDVSMRGATGVLISITGGMDMTLFEVDEAANRIREEVETDANIIFGSTFDDSLHGWIRVSVVATGIDANAREAQRGAQIKSHGHSEHHPSSGETTASESEDKNPYSDQPEETQRPLLNLVGEGEITDRTEIDGEKTRDSNIENPFHDFDEEESQDNFFDVTQDSQTSPHSKEDMVGFPSSSSQDSASDYSFTPSSEHEATQQMEISFKTPSPKDQKKKDKTKKSMGGNFLSRLLRGRTKNQISQPPKEKPVLNMGTSQNPSSERSLQEPIEDELDVPTFMRKQRK